MLQDKRSYRSDFVASAPFVCKGFLPFWKKFHPLFRRRKWTSSQMWKSWLVKWRRNEFADEELCVSGETQLPPSVSSASEQNCFRLIWCFLLKRHDLERKMFIFTYLRDTDILWCWQVLLVYTDVKWENPKTWGAHIEQKFSILKSHVISQCCSNYNFNLLLFPARWVQFL